jgi:hypothetical protein
MTNKLSAFRRRALEVIAANPGITPSEFAYHMWPGSDGWRHHTKCGPKGVTRGGGMRLAGGAHIGKLRTAGLVTWHYDHFRRGGWRITDAGRAALEKDKGK